MKSHTTSSRYLGLAPVSASAASEDGGGDPNGSSSSPSRDEGRDEMTHILFWDFFFVMSVFVLSLWKKMMWVFLKLWQVELPISGFGHLLSWVASVFFIENLLRVCGVVEMDNDLRFG